MFRALSRRGSVPFLTLALLPLVSGCSTVANTTGIVGSQVRVIASAGNIGVAQSRISSAVVDLRNGYLNRSSGTVRSVVENHAIADELVHAFSRWRQERIHPFNVNLLYSQILGRNRAAGTVEISSDPRATPYYFVWLFDTSRSPARVIGDTGGISGDSYTSATWSVSRSAHFVVYHSPYQLAASDRRGLADLEFERAQFIRKFGVSVAPRVNYYLYPTTSEMSSLTGKACGRFPDNIGCALPYQHPPTIHASIWPTYHEPIHVYELSLEPRPKGNIVQVAPLFIGEGTAVALENRQLDPGLSDYCSDLRFVPLDECARIAINHARPLGLLADTGFSKENPTYAYSLGGSFVTYLIRTYGYHAFGRFYYVLAAQPKDRVSDYNVAALQIFHTHITNLLQRWSTSLCRPGCF